MLGARGGLNISGPAPNHPMTITRETHVPPEKNESRGNGMNIGTGPRISIAPSSGRQLNSCGFPSFVHY